MGCVSESSHITVVDTDELTPIDTPVSGLTAHRAFETEQATLIRLTVAPDTTGDWLCHPDRDLYGVLRSGRLELTTPDSPDHLEAESGDCIRMPAGVDYQLTAAGSEPVVVLAALVGSGPLFEAPDDPQASASTPEVARPEEFVDTAQLANLSRHMPFPDAPVQQVVGHADGEMASEWHHHGDNDVFGFVIEGAGYVDDGSADPPLASTGSWFHVPAEVVHRDVNPQDAAQDYVLWLTGSEPRMVRVD